VVDYIFRWMGIQFLPGYREQFTPKREDDASPVKDVSKPASLESVKQEIDKIVAIHAADNDESGDGDSPALRSKQFARFQSDAPACDNCGAITVRNGNCYLCHNCGASMGCS
jgi:ribonucleoside-diphosphate reductase alpha chain